jgi:tetratricopeptide (TPR) repeat protein
MRKCFIVLFCLMAIFSYAYAQNENIDSLHRAIDESRPDSNKVNLLIRMAHAYVYSHPDSCYYFSNEGLKISQNIKNKSKEAYCLSLMGAAFAYIGNFPEALDISLKSLRLAEAIKDPESIAEAVGSLGAVYYFQKDYQKALGYFFQALKIGERTGEKGLIAIQLGNIGDDYLHLNLPDSALYYTHLAYRKSKELRDDDDMANHLNTLGDIYMWLNKNLQALTYYQLARPIEMKLNDLSDFCQTTLGIAGIYQKQNQIDSALFYAYQVMNAAVTGNFNLLEMKAGDMIASLYETDKKPDSAFKYLKQAMILKDSLFSQEKSKSIQNMTFEENIRQQEMEAQKKAAEENHVRNLQLLAIGVFIPVFFLGVLFLSRTKVKPRIVEFLGILSLLLFFEFITDLIYPWVSQLTNENPIWEMLFLVSLAALLEPLNFKLEHWVKGYLVHKPAPVPIPVTVENITNDPLSEKDI